jgi:hypothetical protein
MITDHPCRDVTHDERTATVTRRGSTSLSLAREIGAQEQRFVMIAKDAKLDPAHVVGWIVESNTTLGQQDTT